MNLRIAFLGDIMPGGILHKKSSGVSEEVKNFLNDFDLRIGTLECAIGNEPTFDPVKMSLKQDVIYAPNIDLDKLVELGIDCVSLANNHAFDLGKEGLENTIKQLDRLGIAHCGAGRDYKEASAPAVIDIKGNKVGIIGVCDNRDNTVGYVPIADGRNAGMNSISHNYLQQIRDLRSSVDYLYIVIHWGVEHTFWAEKYMLKFAQDCIKTGADGIIGGHQHRVQPLIKFNNKPIFLGLGNFLFPPRYLRAPRPMYYPSEDEDTSNYPVTDSYPWVDKPTYKIWKKLGRIGAIGVIENYDDKKSSSYIRIVEMTERHSLIFPSKSPFSLKESLQLKLIKLSHFNSGSLYAYLSLKFVRRVVRSIWYRTAPLLSKLRK